MYTLECIVKIIARGFWCNKLAYIRDPWNWLDFFVIVSAYITESFKVFKLLGENGNAVWSPPMVFRGFKVFRVLKTMSIVPGLRSIVQALLHSIRALKHAIVLTVFFLTIFSLVGYQLFQGTFRQKCVKYPPLFVANYDFELANLSDMSDQKYFIGCNETLANNCTWIKQRPMPKNIEAFPNPNIQNFGDEELYRVYSCPLGRIVGPSEISLKGSVIADIVKSTKDQQRMLSKNKLVIPDNFTICQPAYQKPSKDDIHKNFDIHQSYFGLKKEKKRANEDKRLTEIKYNNRNCIAICLSSHLNIDRVGRNMTMLKKSFKRHAIGVHDSQGSMFQNTKLHVEAPEDFDKTSFTSVQFQTSILSFQVRWNVTSFQKFKWDSMPANYHNTSRSRGMYFYIGTRDKPASEPKPCTEDSACPVNYGCVTIGANPDFGNTNFDNFYFAMLTSFRLISLDAWSRLYMLTLHTSGKNMLVFYAVVVFLGSYYLINLILAVVYMAYEEEVAAVEEELQEALELEAAERRAKQTKDDQMEDDEFLELHDDFQEDEVISTRKPSEIQSEAKVLRKSVTSQSTESSEHSRIIRAKSAFPRSRKTSHLRFQSVRAKVQKPESVVSRAATWLENSFAQQNTNRSVHSVNRFHRRHQTNSMPSSPREQIKLPSTSSEKPNFKYSVRQSKSSDRSVKEEPYQRKYQRRVKREMTSSVTDLTKTNIQRKINNNNNRDKFKANTVRCASDSNLYFQDNQFLSRPILSEAKSTIAVNLSNYQFPTAGFPLRAKTGTLPFIFRPRGQSIIQINDAPAPVKTLWEIFAKCNCFSPRLAAYQERLSWIVKDPFFEVFIIICIVCNTFVLASEEYPQTQEQKERHEMLNTFFTSIFTIEMVMKIISLTPVTYFKDLWNVFDCVVVAFSVGEYLMAAAGLSILRAFRLLRIIKLAKSWGTLNKLLRIIGRSLGNVWNLTFVLLIMLYIFAVIGMQLLRANFDDKFIDPKYVQELVSLCLDDDKSFTDVHEILVKNDSPFADGFCQSKSCLIDLIDPHFSYFLNQSNTTYIIPENQTIGIPRFPRWNFWNFTHSFLVVFRIICGEWIECMFDCMNVGDPKICVILFILVFVIGNLVILNLFLALLLNSFSGDALQQIESTDNSLIIAMERMKRIWKSLKVKVQAWVNKKTWLRYTSGIKTNNNAESNVANSILTNLRQPSQITKSVTIIQQPIDLVETYGETRQEDTSSEVTNVENLTVGTSNFVFKNAEIKRDFNSLRCDGTQTYDRPPSPIVPPRETEELLESPAVSIINSQENIQQTNTTVDQMQELLHHTTRSKSSTMFSTQSKESNTLSDMPACCHKVVENIFSGLKKKLISTFSCSKKFFENVYPVYKRGFKKVRQTSYKIIEHKTFESMVIFIILLSSVSLTFEDIHLRENRFMMKVLTWSDYFFTGFFTLEMLLKWFGYGIHFYFTNSWCLLDFAIILISYASFKYSPLESAFLPHSTVNGTVVHSHNPVPTDFSSLRVLRTLRAARPLRALSRCQTMRVVVDALLKALPAIGNVFLVVFLFWLIFSILGVNLFGGRFGKCVNLTNMEILNRHWTYYGVNSYGTWKGFQIVDRPACLEFQDFTKNTSVISGSDLQGNTNNYNSTTKLPSIQWITPAVNFDSVGGGLLALSQVATFMGWLEIMHNAVDIVGKDQQPSYENSMIAYAFFAIFIIFGTFLCLNLFIGVIIDNFNQQKVRKQKDGKYFFVSLS